MAETLERQEAASLASDTESVWTGQTDNWVYSNEPSADLWDVLSTPVSLRRGVARDFASAVAALQGISEVWVTDLEGDLDVAISLDDPALESQVREIFIDLVCERLDPSEGELFVFAAEEMPSWVNRGEQLI
jgi:hypothetical protein